jgi:cyclase
MLAKRIIPALDVKDGRVVKCVKFLNPKDAGDPVDLARLYDREGADEIVFLDITATHENRSLIFDIASRVAEEVFIPFTVGGGIKTMDDFGRMLKTGADKCFVNSAAFRDPDFIRAAADRYGSQCVVVAIDAKLATAPGEPSRWEVYLNGGRVPTGEDAIGWAAKAAECGAGEILLTSMDGDGTQAGYDLALTRAVADAVGNVPVIASGGAGTARHVYEGVTTGGAEAALVASIVHYNLLSIRELKEYMAERSVPVRLDSPPN